MGKLVKVFQKTSIVKVFSDNNIVIEDGELKDITYEYFEDMDKQPFKVEEEVQLIDSDFKYGILVLPSKGIYKFLPANEMIKIVYKDIQVEGRIDPQQPRITRVMAIVKSMEKDGLRGGDRVRISYCKQNKTLSITLSN